MIYSIFYRIQSFVTIFTTTHHGSLFEPALPSPDLITNFVKDRCNIILPSTPSSPKWPLTFKTSECNRPCIHNQYRACCMFSFCLIILIFFECGLKIMMKFLTV